MNIVESYIVKHWGDSVDDPTMHDLEKTIQETQGMDDEHCGFDVGIIGDDDNYLQLEVTKFLKLTLVYDPENLDPETFNEKTGYAKNWGEVLTVLQNFINGAIDQVEEWIDQHKERDS